MGDSQPKNEPPQESSEQKQEASISYQKPGEGQIKPNCDAAWSKNSAEANLAVIARNHQG